MIANADMFAVIGFRTGPGRNELNFYYDMYPDAQLADIWEDAEAQDGWVAMWRYAAERYRDDPIVVGYYLMVEPNGDEMSAVVWDPAEFYPEFEGALCDWNALHPRITEAIREVDEHTPILIDAMGWSSIPWLQIQRPNGDPRAVYTFHQYHPTNYSLQWDEPYEAYPGRLDVDRDGEDDEFNRTWLLDWLSPVEDFMGAHGVPMACNEFGAMRFLPGSAAWVSDHIDFFEGLGINHMVWVWNASYQVGVSNVDPFGYQYGPGDETPETTALREAVSGYWSRNTIRPSDL
jgi:hypothetical protein